MITGGTTGNRMMIEYLRQEIPGLIVPEAAPYFEAYNNLYKPRGVCHNSTAQDDDSDKTASRTPHCFWT